MQKVESYLEQRTAGLPADLRARKVIRYLRKNETLIQL